MWKLIPSDFTFRLERNERIPVSIYRFDFEIPLFAERFTIQTEDEADMHRFLDMVRDPGRFKFYFSASPSTPEEGEEDFPPPEVEEDVFPPPDDGVSEEATPPRQTPEAGVTPGGESNEG